MENKKTPKFVIALALVIIFIFSFLLFNIVSVCYGKIQCNIMIDAIRENDIKKLEWVLKFSNPNTVPGIAVFDVFSENGDRRTPLGAACEVGNFEMVKLLVEDGADVNYIPWNANASPLRLAVQSKSSDNLKIVKFLVENGAIIDSSNSKTRHPAFWMLNTSELPPHGIEILDALKQAGEDTEYKVILQEACYRKHEEVIRYLIEQWGYDASDPYYLCAYCYGFEGYSYETFEYFLERGANPYEKSENGKCAIEYLQEKSPEWAEKLIELAASYGITE